jgi:CDP-diacylglycerol pyrophosphatase
MSRPVLFAVAVAVALAAPAVFAQQQPSREPNLQQNMQNQQELQNRAAQNNARAAELGDRQAWLNSMANLAKLRAKLAEAWQNMGMSPAGAKIVADAYDPELAARSHHVSLRGKSDQDVAGMLQAALAAKHYMAADELLIDYQRQKLKLGAVASSAVDH